jgi:hypothetical protein
MGTVRFRSSYIGNTLGVKLRGSFRAYRRQPFHYRIMEGLPVIQTVRTFAIARFRQTGSEDLMAFK